MSHFRSLKEKVEGAIGVLRATHDCVGYVVAGQRALADFFFSIPSRLFLGKESPKWLINNGQMALRVLIVVLVLVCIWH